MSDPDPKPSGARPSKVTLAATLGGASCLVLIFSLFDTLSRLRGVDMRDQITQTLSEPPFDTMAVTTAEVIAGMRVMAFVAGALAAAGLVLAIYVARRHQGARIGFTVVAALLLLTTPVAGMLTFLIGIAALLLWGEPARAWFGGREPKPAATRRQETLMSAGDRSSGGSSGSSWPYGPQGGGEGSSGSSGGAHPMPQSPQSQSSQPPPYSGSYGDSGEPAEGAGQEQPGSEQPSWQQGQQGQQGQQSWPGQPPYGQSAGQGGQGSYGYPGSQHGQPAPYGQGYDPQSQPYGSPYGSSYGSYGSPGQGQGGSDKRPGTVTAAAVLTMIGALGGVLMGVILMAGLSVDSTAISDQVRQDPSFDQIGWDVDQVLSAIWVVAVIVTLWSLIALVLAVFVLRRQQWARWLLVASATVSALLSLLAILSIISIVPLILSVATVVLLFAGGANDWFSGRSRDGQPPSGPQWSSTPGPW